MPTAARFGQSDAHERRTTPCRDLAAISSASSPANNRWMPVVTGGARPAGSVTVSARASRSMSSDLLTKPISDLRGERGHLAGVDAPRPLDRHGVLLDRPSGPAGQQHGPVAEA